jgi:hypothetical protein
MRKELWVFAIKAFIVGTVIVLVLITLNWFGLIDLNPVQFTDRLHGLR